MKECFECSATTRLHDHHVVPKIYGGTKTILLCEKCHGLVHNRKMNTQALTLKAMTNRRKNNLVMSSKIPFGYKRSKNDPLKLVQVKHQQKIIKEIVQRKNRGERIYHIAKLLSKRGIKTAYNGKWTAKTILSILTRYQKLNS